MKRFLFFILLFKVAEAIRYLKDYNITELNFLTYRVLIFSDNL
jgi:hypothetical protein